MEGSTTVWGKDISNLMLYFVRAAWSSQKKQPDKIHVVNNSSTQQFEIWGDHPDISECFAKTKHIRRRVDDLTNINVLAWFRWHDDYVKARLQSLGREIVYHNTSELEDEDKWAAFRAEQEYQIMNDMYAQYQADRFAEECEEDGEEMDE